MILHLTTIIISCSWQQRQLVIILFIVKVLWMHVKLLLSNLYLLLSDIFTNYTSIWTTNSSIFPPTTTFFAGYYYDPILLTTTTTGSHVFRNISNMYTSGYLYSSSFNESSPSANLKTSDTRWNSWYGQSTFSYTLQESISCYLVITADGPDQTGVFTVVIRSRAPVEIVPMANSCNLRRSLSYNFSSSLFNFSSFYCLNFILKDHLLPLYDKCFSR